MAPGEHRNHSIGRFANDLLVTSKLRYLDTLLSMCEGKAFPFMS